MVVVQLLLCTGGVRFPAGLDLEASLDTVQGELAVALQR